MKKFGAVILVLVLAVIISCTMVHFVNAPGAPAVKNEPSKEPEKEEKVITYVNENLGYSLDFPESWEGYYKIHEDYGNITVAYYGDSDASKGNEHSALGEDGGIVMFFIVDELTAQNENGFLDSVQDIGVARGINYFYATATDFSLSALYDESGKNNDDWDRAHDMMEDVPEILKSFKEL